MRHRSPDERALKAAVIGCGRVAWLLEKDPLEKRPCTHMGAYEALAGEGRIRVVSAADTDPGRLSEFGSEYGVEALYGSYVEMLERERPDIVSVCAYATERRRMVIDAVEAGVRGIWCEKAFATSLEEASGMAARCRDKGVSLIVSHMRRWYGEYEKAKEIIDSGEIGELQSIVAHFSGSLVHTGTHAFDILLWFAGPALWVEGEVDAKGDSLWDLESDPGGRGFIKFKNGAYATVHAEPKRYFFFEFDVICSQGRIRIGNNGLLELYKPAPSRHYTGFMELESTPFPSFHGRNPWVSALSDLIDSVESGKEARSGPDDGRAALELALAIHASARSGGSRISLPLAGGLEVRSR